MTRYILFILLLTIPLVATAQEKQAKPSDQPERYRIYTLAEFITSLQSTETVTFATPQHPTKEQVVVLLDTRTGNTWFLTTDQEKTGDNTFSIKYVWEQIDFRNMKSPTPPAGR